MDSYDLYDPYEDDQSERGDMDMDFLEVELVRSKFTVAESELHVFSLQIQRNLEKIIGCGVGICGGPVFPGL